MALVCSIPPLVEPVSLAELKEYCRIDTGDTSQDGTLVELALDARAWCETYTARRFVQQQWQLLMDFFPGYVDLKIAGSKVSSPFVSGSNAVLVGIRYAIVLPYPPVRTIDLFQYQDANGSVTPLVSATDYTADLKSNPARLTPPFGRMWPVARVVVNAVEVDYTVGYAKPLVLNTSAASPSVNTGSPPAYTFLSSDVGRPVWIPGAGPLASDGSHKDLNTILTAVSGGTATMRDQAMAAVSNATGLLVNAGIPAHWAKIKRAIKVMTANGYDQRLPRKEIENTVANILTPVRDLRK